MTTKDYYKILGVNEEASVEEIKKLYRELAKKYHPDRNKGNKQAEDRFKEINEAYDVLGDPEKRKKYDQFRKLGGAGLGGEHVSWEDLMKQFQGQGRPFGSGRGFDFSNFGRAFGLDDLFETFTNGPTGSQRTRPGFEHMNNGSAFETEETMTRENLDVRLEASLNLAQILLGTKIRLRTPQGKKIDLRIPPGTDPGHVFRIPRMGKQSGTETGDLYVIAKVNTPKDLTPEQHDLFEKFARSLGLKY